ncbi:MAG TPA: hypothetical protein VHJ20_17705 [Polyangia bacterium]|nr:hypothetical protein [Polyangia bacterium]
MNTTKPPTLILAFVLAAVAAPSVAHAGACVQLDTAHDNLTDQERSGVMTMFVQELQQQGQQVTPDNCSNGTYVVYHVRLGYSVNVVINGPQGYRQATARAIEEVPALYSQMIRSLLTGQPMNTSNMTVDRTNVTSAQAAPMRVEADSLWYVRLGYSAIASSDVSGGPAFGFGYRYELDSLGIDVSFLNFAFPSEHSTTNGTSSSASFSGSLIKLQALYFLNPIANGSFYLGGGAAWGFTAAVKEDAAGNFNELSGSGLQAELSAGYEFLRASTIRMFAQFDATLPFYTIDGLMTDATGTTTTKGGEWAPTFSLSVGLGWGRGTSRIHVVP